MSINIIVKLRVKVEGLKKSWRFSSIMVEKIKESRNLENYVIINFSSPKKYAT